MHTDTKMIIEMQREKNISSCNCCSLLVFFKRLNKQSSFYDSFNYDICFFSKDN